MESVACKRDNRARFVHLRELLGERNLAKCHAFGAIDGNDSGETPHSKEGDAGG